MDLSVIGDIAISMMIVSLAGLVLFAIVHDTLKPPRGGRSHGEGPGSFGGGEG